MGVRSAEQRHVLRRATSSLADIVLVEKEPGYTARRSTCPDGQFWLPIHGDQIVSTQRGTRKQLPFDLMYYHPKEPAVRTTGTPTIAYGVRLMLSGLREDECDDSWLQGRELTWDAKKMVVSLIVNSGRDPHLTDEVVARWIARPITSQDESKHASWMSHVVDHLYADPNLTLIELSRRVGIVPCYLSAQFNRIRGQSLSSLRRQIMLDRAMRYRTEKPLNEAAIEAGFYDASHFHRACVAELGVKASDLRRHFATT